MSRQLRRQNPFLALTEPEVILAAVESSEPLSRLHRHLCRPLDRSATEESPPSPNSSPPRHQPGAGADPTPTR